MVSLCSPIDWCTAGSRVEGSAEGRAGIPVVVPLRPRTAIDAAQGWLFATRLASNACRRGTSCQSRLSPGKSCLDAWIVFRGRPGFCALAYISRVAGNPAAVPMASDIPDIPVIPAGVQMVFALRVSANRRHGIAPLVCSGNRNEQTGLSEPGAGSAGRRGIHVCRGRKPKGHRNATAFPPGGPATSGDSAHRDDNFLRCGKRCMYRIGSCCIGFVLDQQPEWRVSRGRGSGCRGGEGSGSTGPGGWCPGYAGRKPQRDPGAPAQADVRRIRCIGRNSRVRCGYQGGRRYAGLEASRYAGLAPAQVPEVPALKSPPATTRPPGLALLSPRRRVPGDQARAALRHRLSCRR